MRIKSDRWIRRMAESQRMIEPFESNQIKQANGHKRVSCGTPLPAKIYTNEGVAQVIFLEAAADDIYETSYKDRGGKYQGQVGVTLPKI